MNRLFIGILAGGLGGGIVGAYMARRDQETEITLEQPSALNQRAPQGRKITRTSHMREGFDLDLLSKMPKSSRDMDILDDYCEGLTEEQLAEAIRKIKVISVEDKHDLIQLLLLKLAKKNAHFALEEGRRLKVNISGVFDIWASKTPEEAAAYYVENRAQLEMEDVRPIAKQWGAINMESAWEWASMLTGGERVKAREVLLEILIKSDLPLAVEKFKRLPAEDQVRETDLYGPRYLYSKLVSEWAVKDCEAVIEWSNTLSLADQEAAIRELSLKKPERAMEWAIENLDKDNIVSRFTIDQAMSNWQRKDAMAAKQWIHEQSQGKWKNILVQQYAGYSNGSRNFPQDIAFVEEMKPAPKTRQEALSNLVSEWRCKNNKEATEWVNSSSLSAEEKKAILDKNIGSKSVDIFNE